MNSAFWKMMFGEVATREYYAVRIDGGIREKVYLTGGAGMPVLDISSTHWILCLYPVVIGVWAEKGRVKDLNAAITYHAYFRDGACESGQDPAKDAFAMLRLDILDIIPKENGSLFLFRAFSQRIDHSSWIKERILYSKFYKKSGSTFRNMMCFAAAFSYPRRVRIVSFRDGDHYNIFPMDLLGNIAGTDGFVFGLRHTNPSLARMIATKKVVVAEAPFGYKSLIYQLARNHGVSPPPVDQLPFGVVASARLGFWLPDWVEHYREIQIDKTIDLGSHMLLSGTCTGEYDLAPSSPGLYHIHALRFLRWRSLGVGYPEA
jgi:hypothetical protein